MQRKEKQRLKEEEEHPKLCDNSLKNVIVTAIPEGR